MHPSIPTLNPWMDQTLPRSRFSTSTLSLNASCISPASQIHHTTHHPWIGVPNHPFRYQSWFPIVQEPSLELQAIALPVRPGGCMLVSGGRLRLT
ncbi:hypothetical protein VFPPC_18001 [Pochonia chlamydosporia 170]|uniref:Uncharacterized protein n=1 Tax=Pochonia chlamydosporia 170 TaxID=1380566 RepID=A0A219APJ5_METCM|nr:hypothetical protein VFPPC_18001 [Pochonia chlamydosporia 170]OWT42746.1 hypothetical protein VFPPC_18001 [Pochonia chlamydosporia 170]